MEQKLSQKIIRNTIFSIIGRFWGVLVALFLTPYIIHHIGVERYGIWAVIGVLTGYFGLLDFGVGSSFVKYIAEFYTKKDWGKMNQLVNSGIVFYSIFAIFIIGLGFVLINLLLPIFKIPPHLYHEASFVFLFGIALIGVSSALSAFGSVADGLQRMDISSKVGLVMSIPNIAGVIYFLEKGYGLRGLIINNGIVLGLNNIIDIIIAFKLLPELRFNPCLFDWEMFKKLFGYGCKLQIAKISSMISLNVDKLLIGYFLSVGMVTFYQLGSSIIEQAKTLVLLFPVALVPAFSEIDAKGEKNKLIDGYARGTKYLALVATPLFTLIIVSAHQIMGVWMGNGYERSALIIQIIGVGWLCAILSGMRSVIIQAIAKPEIEMKAGLIAVVLNIPLSILFIVWFGFVGVALGTSIALFFSATYGFARLHKELHIPLEVFIKTTILKSIVICASIGLLVRGVTVILQRFLVEPVRTANLAIFLVQAVLFFGIYLKVLLSVKPFDNTDIRMFFESKPIFIRQLAAKFSR